MSKVKKYLPFLIYMMIWSFYILFAWFNQHPGQMIDTSLFVLYLLLPAAACIISIIYGQSQHHYIYLMTLFFGFMELLGYHLGFIHMTFTDIERILIPSTEIVLYGFVPSIVGILIGKYITRRNRYSVL